VDDEDLAELKVQHELAEAWHKLAKSPDSGIKTATKVHVLPSIQDAIALVESKREGEEPVDVLVSGSLHLVGGIFEVAKLEFAL
jgi:folylpolyglutamate synthase